MATKKMDLSSFIEKTIDASGNKVASKISKGTISDIKEYLDTGSYMLNAQISGDLFKGIPMNRTVGFAGENAVGKSYICRHIAKIFLEKYEYSNVVVFRSEDDMDSTFWTESGVDGSRVVDYPISSIETFKNQTIKLLNEYRKMKDEGYELPKTLWILDSLGNLSSEKEIEDAEQGSNKVDMTKTKLLKATFRIINLKLSEFNIPFLITNHVYSVIGSHFPTVELSGGSGLKFAASIISILTRSKYKDGTSTTGVILTSKMYKNRLAQYDTKVPVMLSFKNGMHRYYGLTEQCLEAGIWKKSGNRIELKDGSKLYEKEILKKADEIFTQELLEELNVFIKEKFSYGTGNVEDDDEILNEEETLDQKDDELLEDIMQEIEKEKEETPKKLKKTSKKD